MVLAIALALAAASPPRPVAAVATARVEIIRLERVSEPPAGAEVDLRRRVDRARGTVDFL